MYTLPGFSDQKIVYASKVLCTVAIVHACTIAIVQACTIAIVHSCTADIAHVSCFMRLMVQGVEYGGSGGRSLLGCSGVWGAAGPPTFETDLFLDHFFLTGVSEGGKRGG